MISGTIELHRYLMDSGRTNAQAWRRIGALYAVSLVIAAVLIAVVGLWAKALVNG